MYSGIVLLKKGKVRRERLCIIDPHDKPMYKWKKNTVRIGMEYLRSPSVHHIDIDPFSLKKYAIQYNQGQTNFYGRYKRPSLNLFNEHCESIVKEVNLYQCWHQGWVNSIEKEQEFWKVMTKNGDEIRAQNIVLSISINNQLNFPGWAKELRSVSSNRVFHIFEENPVPLSSLQPPIAVIGGGITAAHVTIKLSDMYPGKVFLIKRHPFRIEDFDSDPGWLGPKNLTSYHKIKSYEERRWLIQEARNKGSLTKELFYKLKRLEGEKKITIIDGEVKSTFAKNNGITLKMEDSEIDVNNILLATGFIPSPPRSNWLGKLMKDLDLICAKCGYPIISKTLEWYPQLYVTGPLAELEIGPIARNISGARHAAEKIVSNL